MLVLEIAAGIVLGVLVLAYWPLVWRVALGFGVASAFIMWWVSTQL